MENKVQHIRPLSPGKSAEADGRYTDSVVVTTKWQRMVEARLIEAN